MHRTSPSGFFLALVLAVAAALFGRAPVRARAQGDDLRPALEVVERALHEAKEGDLPKARAEWAAFEGAWEPVEDAVRAKSPALYAELEEEEHEAEAALEKGDLAVASEALEKLEHVIEEYMTLGGTAAAAPARQVTLMQTVGLLDEAAGYLTAGNFAAAAHEVDEFKRDWLYVEGEVKTRSADAYRDTESDMARAATLIEQQSPDAAAVVARMHARLMPYVQTPTRYGVADAMLILLREGLEALLVIVALLAFLRKSGNADKNGYVWGGVAAGLAVSVIAGIAIHAAFQSVITPANRELIEGVTGLVAAGLLIYMSYWLHSKSNADAWQRYIKDRSTAALASGSLTGIALLSFLSIFREGAETAIFFVGMAPSIAMSDMLLGLALGAVLLIAAGFALLKFGLRLPIAAFFSVASVLVFYLCFKFVGSGIHALQVAGVLPTNVSQLLPEAGFFGLYPTWETTLPQLVLLAAAVAVAVWTRVRPVSGAR